MLTIHVEDQHGVPIFVAPTREPVTITLCRSDESLFASLPDGPHSWVAGRGVRRKLANQPTRTQLGRIVDHVAAWSGVFLHGQPLACTRSVVISTLQARPWIRRQLERAIKELESSSSVGAA